jgi:SAM-dependent methyltransferase
VLPFTGERYIPSQDGEIRLEHLHRYVLACSLAHGKAVLDMACGEGYGAALLGRVAREVIGIDLSSEAIAHAQATYEHQRNVRFIRADASQTGLPDACVDVVVSFETIEHLAEQTEMLTEVRRVLRPEGVLIISSPNRPVYNLGRSCSNDFHVKELDLNEFEEVLKINFSSIEYYGQRLAMGTVVQPLNERLQRYDSFADDGKEVRRSTFRMHEPVYFIAVCGALCSALPKLGASLLAPEKLDLVEHYRGFARWASRQDQELIIRDNNVRHQQAEVIKLEEDVKVLQEKLMQREIEVSKLKDQQAQYHYEMVRVKAQIDLLCSFNSYSFDADLDNI